MHFDRETLKRYYSYHGLSSRGVSWTHLTFQTVCESLSSSSCQLLTMSYATAVESDRTDAEAMQCSFCSLHKISGRGQFVLSLSLTLCLPPISLLFPFALCHTHSLGQPVEWLCLVAQSPTHSSVVHLKLDVLFPLRQEAGQAEGGKRSACYSRYLFATVTWVCEPTCQPRKVIYKSDLCIFP